MVAFVRQKVQKLELGIIGPRVPPLRGHRALHVDEQEALGFRFGHAGVETLVRLLECHDVIPRVSPEDMLFDVQAEQCLGIFFDVQNGPIVVGPCEVGLDVGNRSWQDLAGRQILEAQGELASADGVFAKRQPRAIRRDLQSADSIVVMTDGERVGIQQDLFGRVERALAPRKNRVFLAVLEAGVVPIPVLAIGNAGIVLFDPSDNFLVQRILERQA